MKSIGLVDFAWYRMDDGRAVKAVPVTLKIGGWSLYPPTGLAIGYIKPRERHEMRRMSADEVYDVTKDVWEYRNTKALDARL